ncbi:MAG: glycosyltransferase [Candidatus Ancillula sp.]|nr:glycosyltransferase [Candidatus Ancillula sp.]
MATYEPNRKLFELQLRSIMEQSVKSWNCIITHDPSESCTVEQLQELVDEITLKDQRFKVLANRERLGFYDNFGRGLEASKKFFPNATWIALSDQDDNWNTNKLEKLLPYLDKYTLVSGQARIVKYNIKKNEQELLKFNTERENTGFVRLFLNNKYSGALMVFSANLLDDILPLPSSFSSHKVHDHAIAVIAKQHGKITIVDEVVQDYIQHDNNAIGEFTENRSFIKRAVKFPYIPFLQWRFSLAMRLFPALGIIPGILIASILAITALKNTQAIPQLFDEVFHLNAVRFIMDTGNWSPFGFLNVENGAYMTGLAPPTVSYSAASFYPSGYHTLAALLGAIFHLSAIAACFILNFIAIGVVFPIGVALLVANFAPKELKFQAYLFGALTASITASLPYRLLTWGGIWPFMFGLLLLPLCIWIIIHQTKLTSTVLSLVIIIPFLSIIHPSVALIYLLVLLIFSWQKYRRPILMIILTAGFIAIWIIFRPDPSNYNLSTIANPLVACGMFFFNVASKNPLAVPIIFSILVILGVLVCMKKKNTRWLPVLWLIFLIAYVVTLSTSSNLRAHLTGVIYANPHRMIALTGIVSAPLAAFGLLLIYRKCTERAQKIFKFKSTRPYYKLVSSIVVGILVFISAVQLGTTSAMEARSATNLDVNNRLTKDDAQLMQLIGEKLSKKDSLILANANQGGSLNYAISGVLTLPTHAFFSSSNELSFLFTNLNKMEYLETSCRYIENIELANEQNPKMLFVLETPDSRLDLLDGENGMNFDGLQNLENTIGAEVVLEVGNAKLVRPICA